jgi:hypothetical protein
LVLYGGITKESTIDQTCSPKISPNPSFPKRGIPPFGKGREGGISSLALWPAHDLRQTRKYEKHGPPQSGFTKESIIERKYSSNNLL